MFGESTCIYWEHFLETCIEDNTKYSVYYLDGKRRLNISLEVIKPIKNMFCFNNWVDKSHFVEVIDQFGILCEQSLTSNNDRPTFKIICQLLNNEIIKNPQ